MTIQQSIDELLRCGCSAYIGRPCPAFMGLVTPEDGMCVVVDLPDGRRFTKHYPADMARSVTSCVELSLRHFLLSGESGAPIGEPLGPPTPKVSIASILEGQ